ncbi:MAG: guanylate kinase [Aquificae bacterium]|nr:guanylate kinase [Aquificota bacterium]
MAKLFILSAPSGTGKSTIAGKLLQQLEGIRRVITATTREPRPGEKHGVDYIFMSKEEFEEGIEKGLFLEYANVYGNYYGTPRDQVEKNLREGYDSLLVIDVQGAFKVKKIYPDAVSVFLLPPSLEELKRRMIGRGYRDSNAQRRLETARDEIPCAKSFDYIIINDFVDKAVEQLKSIVVASRCERENILSNLKSLVHNEELVRLIEGGECYVQET